MALAPEQENEILNLAGIKSLSPIQQVSLSTVWNDDKSMRATSITITTPAEQTKTFNDDDLRLMMHSQFSDCTGSMRKGGHNYSSKRYNAIADESLANLNFSKKQEELEYGDLSVRLKKNKCRSKHHPFISVSSRRSIS